MIQQYEICTMIPCSPPLKISSMVCTGLSSISSHSRHHFLGRNVCTTISWFDTVHSATYYCTSALVRPFTLAGRWWCMITYWHYLFCRGCSPFTNPYAHAVWELPDQTRTRALFRPLQVDVFVFIYTVVGPSVPKALATC